MKNLTWMKAGLIAICLTGSGPGLAVVADEVDTFTGGTEGWSPNTTNPGGTVLQLSTVNPKLVARNLAQWTGNYNALAPAITLEMDIANPGPAPLTVRIAMGDTIAANPATTGTWYISAGVAKAAGTGFTTHSFALNSMTLAGDTGGAAALSSVLGSVAEMRILHSASANHGPLADAKPVGGILQIDNIRISVPAAQTISGFTATPASLTFGGGTSALSATASSGLTVTFSSLTTGVCTVAGSTVTIVTAGTCTVAANQAGNGSFFPAPQVTLNIPIAQATQTISGFTVTPNPGTFGGTSTAAATASSGLTVTFGSTTPAVCTVAGTTVTYVGTGTCTVTANQAGNTNFSAAPQLMTNVTVNPANQTISGFAAAPDPGSFGGTSALSATASSGLAVTFASTTPGVCTVAGSTATYVTAGTCTLTADQAGNANYNAAPQVMINVTVNAVVPGAPTLVSADPGPGPTDVTVVFTPPTSDGGSPITSYDVDCSGFMASGPASPIIVSGIPSGTPLVCTVVANNAVGAGPASAPLGGASAALAVPTLSTWSKFGLVLILMLLMFRQIRNTAR